MRSNSCNFEELAACPQEANLQGRPRSSAKSRPALHQTTTPGTLPSLLKETPELSVLLTVGEVAERLKLSRATVYSLVKRGELPSIRVSNSIRVLRDAVEALAR